MKTMRLLALLALALVLAGCGSTASGPSGTGATYEGLALRGRELFVQTNPPVVLELLDGLGEARATFVFAQAGRWNGSWVERTGTAEEAARAAGRIVTAPGFGPAGLYALLSRTGDDPGQALVLCFGRNLDPALQPVEGAERARDSLVAVQATPPETQGQNPLVVAALTPELGNLATFHALRELHPDTLTPVLHQQFWGVRAAIPEPAAGEEMQKAIKLGDIANYLSGKFGAFAMGFMSSHLQVEMLHTPAEIIEGLRLDYPGGFQGDARIGLLRFGRDAAYAVPVAYPSPLGPVTGGLYPYTGNGFTATVRANAIPEYSIPSSGKMPLSPGSTLVEVDEAGVEHLRGTWNGAQWVTPLGAEAPKPPAAWLASGTYRVDGYLLEAVAQDADNLYLAFAGQALPGGLLEDQQLVGRLEYRGRLRKADPRLVPVR